MLAVTGVALMASYAAAPQTAWASVHYVEYVAAGGWLVRGMHAWAAQALLALAAIHVAQGAMVAAYRKPGEIVWWLELLLVAFVLLEAITGGLLPWDQRGWWARAVEANIVGLAPLFGDWLARTLLGGSEPGALALARAYAAHVLLIPAAMSVAFWVSRKLVRRGAAGEPASIEPEARGRRWGGAIGVLLGMGILFGLTVAKHGWSLDSPADPLSEYPARPEWFLMPLFELRRLFDGPAEFWATTLVPAGAVACLALLPWIDHPPGRVRRLAIVAAIFGTGVALAGLALVQDARDPQFAKQREKVDRRAARAIAIAMDGVPPEGALQMVRTDVELRGQELFEQRCAGCHVLGYFGDPKKAKAANLNGWGTPEWNAAMMHDPDGAEYFGQGPYKGQMPSMDVRPRDRPPPLPWKPMIKSEEEMKAVSLYLAAEGDEPGDEKHKMDDATRALGEKIINERCEACHPYRGRGDTDGTGLSPELAGFGSVTWTRTQVANPDSWSTYRITGQVEQGFMPKFELDLSPSDIDTVARWTRAHARGVPLSKP